MRIIRLAVCCLTGALAPVCGHAAPADPAYPPAYSYDPGLLAPFGRANPAQTDPQARIFDPMIGVHDCKHRRTDYQSGKVTEQDAVWVWSYDMNGYGVRDVYRYGPAAPASQRIYDPKKKEWHVWYFIGQNFYYAGEWIGGRKDGRLVFEQDTEENGRPVLSRLEYLNVTEDGFDWKSTNIDKENGEAFVDWTISCTKRH